ncbi:MAG: plasmid pRiA4b ORF-3 family protein [Verrucomicrobiota bacterium]
MIRIIDTGGGGTSLYQLKITLQDCKPSIWRRIIVRADMKLHRLHRVIQIVMGWSDCHLHQFRLGRVYYGIPEAESDDLGGETLNEKQFTVADLAPTAKQRFIYEYDFGDSWEHDIVVEKVLPPDADFKHPTCLGGANASPPRGLRRKLWVCRVHGRDG